MASKGAAVALPRANLPCLASDLKAAIPTYFFIIMLLLEVLFFYIFSLSLITLAVSKEKSIPEVPDPGMFQHW